MEDTLLTYVGEFIPSWHTGFVSSTAANNFAKGIVPQFSPVLIYISTKNDVGKREVGRKNLLCAGYKKTYGAHCTACREEKLAFRGEGGACLQVYESCVCYFSLLNYWNHTRGKLKAGWIVSHAMGAFKHLTKDKNADEWPKLDHRVIF